VDVSDCDNANRRAIFRMSNGVSSDNRSDERAKWEETSLIIDKSSVTERTDEQTPKTLRTVDKMVGSNLEQDVATYMLSSLLSTK
jgi:hypothetical protein